MFVVVTNCLIFYLSKDPLDTSLSFLQKILFLSFNGVVLLYFIINLIRARRKMRLTYSIPEKLCRGQEDPCLSILCCPFVMMQMNRHTADFDTYSAACFSAVRTWRSFWLSLFAFEMLTKP